MHTLHTFFRTHWVCSGGYALHPLHVLLSSSYIPLNVQKEYEKYAKYAAASGSAAWRLLAMHTFLQPLATKYAKCAARVTAARRRMETAPFDGSAQTYRDGLFWRTLCFWAASACECVRTPVPAHIAYSLCILFHRGAPSFCFSLRYSPPSALCILCTLFSKLTGCVVVGVHCIHFMCSSLLLISLSMFKKSMKSMQSMQEQAGVRCGGFWRCILFGEWSK